MKPGHAWTGVHLSKLGHEFLRPKARCLQVRDWTAGDAVTLGDFTFKNPTNAEKVDVKDIKSKLGELPENCCGRR